MTLFKYFPLGTVLVVVSPLSGRKESTFLSSSCHGSSPHLGFLRSTALVFCGGQWGLFFLATDTLIYVICWQINAPRITTGKRTVLTGERKSQGSSQEVTMAKDKAFFPPESPKQCPRGHDNISWSVGEDHIYCWQCNHKHPLLACFRAPERKHDESDKLYE